MRYGTVECLTNCRVPREGKGCAEVLFSRGSAVRHLIFLVHGQLPRQ